MLRRDPVSPPRILSGPQATAGWALSQGATTSLQGRQEVWGREAPSGIHKTNSQNQIQRSGGGRRRARTVAVGRPRMFSLWPESLSGDAPNGLHRETAPPEWTSPSPRSETGQVRFGILGPRGQDTLQAGLSEELAGLGSKKGGSKYSSL